MEIIDGKKISNELFAEVRTEVERLNENYQIQPGLAVVIVGADPASQIYVNRKVKKANDLGIYSVKHELPAATSQADVLELVADLNRDAAIHGILVQSPPPPHIDERAITEAILPAKDVDCFHPYNVGKMLIGDEDGFYPCTPSGIMILLARYGIATSGKHAVILGRSNIVGKPMAALLSRKGNTGNATVTLCHSRTADIAELTRSADIVVAAIGKPSFVTQDMISDGAVVIDVGINRIDDPAMKKGYRLAGDVDFANVSQRCAYITPVPGGVGPMTIAVLMYNSVKACCLQHDLPPPKPLF